ncbi:hypothetical protein [Mesorhizobium sp. M1A.F.Ca.IN.022.06.1.1]|nr:hypothetical protein [Mesorhizobium sp. M1A.F.Ca.IN.022.06.1.1]
MSGFQTQVAYNPAPAVEGDFASTNPALQSLPPLARWSAAR